MEEKNQILQRLLKEGNWSDEDRKWFLEYLDNNDTSYLQKLMQLQFTENISSVGNTMDDNARKILELIHQKIKTDTQPAKVIRLSVWRKVAAAAVIVFLIGTGTYFLFFGNEKKEIAKTENKNISNDIAPGGNKATLTLANGSTIVLNNVKNGTVTQQGNSKILKLANGQLAYNALNEKPTEVIYNTISTPRGGQYQVTLSDGTRVWLNAASSLHYPTSFNGKERNVELTGEAYFEVKHNAAMPFKVNVAGREEVEVLGTHFNINSYEDEPVIKTTLLEGRVKVSNNISSLVIMPGEQSIVSGNGKIEAKQNVDVDAVMAWKNGQFIFNSVNIQTIMRQISRWYDVDISFEGNISKEPFSGIVSRNENVSQVLKIMEQGGVKFFVEGKRIIVRQ